MTEPFERIAIRPMTREDLDSVVELALATPLWQRHGFERAAFAVRLERGLEAGASILVAVEEDAAGGTQIAGFIWYVARGAFQRSGYVMLLGVANAYRRRGVGRLLVAAAEAPLFQAGPDVFLLVSDFNQEAQRFYAALGYTQVGAIPDYITPGVEELIFRKRA